MVFHLVANNIITSDSFPPAIKCVTLLRSFIERWLLRCGVMNEFRVRLALLHPNSHKIRSRYYTLYATVGRSSLASHTEKGETNRSEWRMFSNKIHPFIVHMPHWYWYYCFRLCFSEYIHHGSAGSGSCHSWAHCQPVASFSLLDLGICRTETIACIAFRWHAAVYRCVRPYALLIPQNLKHLQDGLLPLELVVITITTACSDTSYFLALLKFHVANQPVNRKSMSEQRERDCTDAYSKMSWIYCAVHMPTFYYADFWYLNRQSSRRTTPIDNDDIISFIEFHFNFCDRFQSFAFHWLQGCARVLRQLSSPCHAVPRCNV